MKLGIIKKLLLFPLLIFINFSFVLADDKIQSIPLINLENLSPTFEEDKIELEKNDEQNVSLTQKNDSSTDSKILKGDKIYINLKALDKITAKTSTLRLALGEKQSFGPLEIKALKCQYSEENDVLDTVAYIQIKDLSSKNNDQVFLFNGWTFASNPTFQSIDHPVYDLWITSCENI